MRALKWLNNIMKSWHIWVSAFAVLTFGFLFNLCYLLFMAINHIREKIISPLDKGVISTVLQRTAGIWRKKRIHPLRYQRKLRQEYETMRLKTAR